MNEHIRSIDWSQRDNAYGVTFKCGHTQPLAISDVKRMRASRQTFAELARGLQCEVCAPDPPMEIPAGIPAVIGYGPLIHEK